MFDTGRPDETIVSCVRRAVSLRAVPKLWKATIDEHRRSVQVAILDSTWALAAEHGPLRVTMSQVADAAGIGRATLYKYFPDVESILVACHARHVTAHLEQLAELRDRAGGPGERLDSVLSAYARIAHLRERHASPELGALLHRGEHVANAQRELLDVFRELLLDAAQAGLVRDDVAPDHLATYCLHALGAASSLPDQDAVRGLVEITLAGLRPSADNAGY